VRMTVERSLWVTVCGFVAGKVPNDQRLVAGSGEEHVGARVWVSTFLMSTCAERTDFSKLVAREVTQPL